MRTDYHKLITGEPIKCIAKIKPTPNLIKEDIKIIGNTISLIDPSNRCKLIIKKKFT